jgi:hypothetical protein
MKLYPFAIWKMFSAEEIPEDATQPETVNTESENKSEAWVNRKPASFVEFEARKPSVTPPVLRRDALEPRNKLLFRVSGTDPELASEPLFRK